LPRAETSYDDCVNKRFRVCTLDQQFLLPPSLQDWLPEDHLARFVADVMNELDLSPIYAKYERSDGRGLSAYHPLLLARLLLYGYCIGTSSSRKLEKATYDNVAFRYLAADQHPDHDTLASFRQEHLDALAGLFVQALKLCQKAGLVKLGNVAIDGTKIMANASTRRSVSYQKISDREQYWQNEVQRLLKQAQQTDQQEDQRFGQGQPAAALPDELAHAQSRLQRLKQAKAELEQEAQEQLQAATTNLPLGKRGRR
jgi:transposase